MNQMHSDPFQQAVFLDESALKAYMNPDDPNYLKARSVFHELDDMERRLVTTNVVIFDVHQWLKQACSYTEAEYFINTIDKAVALDKLTIVSGSSVIEKESRQLLIDCPQFELSLNEAMTSIVMITHQIKRIFTFNRSYSALTQMFTEIKIIPSW
ncbi:hypothetical protein [Paenibacillus sp. MBLB4367]|uniref:hypothetical protein n=1 Tax=Paenibacillus sp. MBLB4367 TaxID=3384767 RepID=UPI0039083F71